MSPFRRGPHCADHPAWDARYCHDCWQEILAGTRPDTMIGRHFAAPDGAAFDVKETETV
jgi:hypothetical protein